MSITKALAAVACFAVLLFSGGCPGRQNAGTISKTMANTVGSPAAAEGQKAQTSPQKGKARTATQAKPANSQ
ncbi:MAG: hypothetical protein WC889_06490 [Myxococcota bacterium]|jgi:hypothetical protein